MRYPCLKPPPEAISVLARNKKKPEERRRSQGPQSGPQGCLDAAAVSGTIRARWTENRWALYSQETV